MDGDDTLPRGGRARDGRCRDRAPADMVVGDRPSSTQYTRTSPFHNFINDLVRSYNKSFVWRQDQGHHDRYRAFSYQFVKTYPVLSCGFEIDRDDDPRPQRNMQVENVVIDYRDRPEGSESKPNTYPTAFKVLGTIARLFKNHARSAFSYSGRVSRPCSGIGLQGSRCWASISGLPCAAFPDFDCLLLCAGARRCCQLIRASSSEPAAKDARDFEFSCRPCIIGTVKEISLPLGGRQAEVSLEAG